MAAAPAQDPRLALESPAPRAQWLLLLLVVVLPLALVLVLPVAGGDAGGPVRARMEAALVVGALLLALFVLLRLLMRRHRLLHDAGGIDVATSFYRRRLAWPELRLQDARVLSLDERTEFKPMVKSNGMSLPGFRSGWFRSRQLDRMFVATSGGDRVLWLPTTLGYALLLQPRNPRGALEALRELALREPAAMAPGKRDR